MNDGGLGLHAILTFGVHGLAAPALEPRWLAVIGGSADEEPLAITSGHGDESRCVMVTTGQRSPDEGGLDLLTRTVIDYRSAEGKKWPEAAGAFNADQLAHYEVWDQLTWLADDVEVSARSFTIDSSRAAISTHLADGLLWVYGHGVSPTDLEFRPSDGKEHGVDLDAPLHFPISLIASRAFGGLPDNS
jgi:hypothetical protein